MRPLLVGQAPGPTSDPLQPLSGASGRRLARLCRLDLAAFLEAFDRANLVGRWPGAAAKGDAFPLEEARQGAVRLGLSRALSGRPVVLLGGNVARAFGFDPDLVELLRFRPLPFAPEGVAFCPHPSGVSRWWNEAANVRRAGRFWRSLALRASAPDVSSNDL